MYQTQYDARFADPTYKVYTFLIYATIALSVWLVIGRKTVVDEDVIHDRKRWIAICIVVFFFVVFANSFGFGIIVYQRFSIVDSQSLGFLSALLFTYDAICSLMILIVLLVVSSRNHLIREVEVLNDINRRQQKHYEISQEYRDIINMKMHDLKKSLAHEGSSQFSNSPQTVRALQETLKSYDALFHTGSSAVDTILNDKSLYCAHRGITLQCLVNGAALSFMEEADIYSLVGNIMDNAIEAVESIDSDELSKSIMLNISHEGTMIVLRETNQFSGDIVEKNGVIQSKKDDATNHGFGMRSVQFVVRKYGGQMSFSTDNNTFDLTIILPAHSN
ncbi:ATP-binding protein [Alloscardovia criceti]|uniref:ATP-binding protein n=1 Tax=Alloscardovia criceti TaxID=356828 RepID=UPI0014616EF8|nr:ATP-binding protein [Alloscardovia criceti]